MAISVAGETGLIDVLADPGTPTFGSGIEVVGKTAKITVRAQTSTSVPTFILSGGNYTETGETAQITVVAHPGIPVIGSVQPGDYWTSPTIIAGSGTKTWDVDNYTDDINEPIEYAVTPLYKSRWFRYSSADTVLQFSLTALATGTWLEVWEAVDPLDASTWSYVAGGAEPVISSIGFVPAGTTIIIRVACTGVGVNTSATLAWDATIPLDEDPGSDSGNLQVMFNEVMLETPDNLQFSLFNADDNALVTVSLSGAGQLGQFLADDSGVVLGASVPIPELAAGTYSLSFSGGGEATTVTLQVLEEPVPLPTAPAADDSPILPVGVHRWILQDPAGVLVEYEFSSNPETMSDPYGARWITGEHTSAPNGQALLWEALARSIDWEFAGYLETEADLEAIEAYVNLRRRFYLIDHRDRVWIVAFTSFDAQPKRVIGKSYAHKYTIRAQLYGEVT